MADYGPPVDQLSRLGDEFLDETSHDYAAMGIGLEHVPELSRMAVDPRWDQMDAESPELWGPIHAWRALGQLRAEGGIPTLVGILADQDEDEFNDWITEEIPPILGRIGPAAIPELTALLERETAGEHARSDATRSLTEVGKQHPDARDEVVAILTRNLERAEGQDPVFNAWLISDLIDLGAKEAAGAIERAYAGEFVDDSIPGTWYDVWHELELEGEPPPRTEPRNPIFRENPFLRDRAERPPATPRPENWRAPADRKARNKELRKLEKKARKKGRKRR